MTELNLDYEFPVLTRYLYVSFDVHYSLLQSLGVNSVALPPNINTEASLFWAFELYYSGFQENTIRMLRKITNEVFPKKDKIMEKIFEEWDVISLKKQKTYKQTIEESKNEEEMEAVALANIVCNLTGRIYSKTIHNKNPKLIIRMKYNFIQHLMNIIPPNVRPYRVLNEKCLFETHKCDNYDLDERKNVIQSIYDGKWLYYCYLTPVWKSRFNEFGGKINNLEKTVDFYNDENENAFYEKYGYEPDNNSYLVEIIIGKI